MGSEGLEARMANGDARGDGEDGGGGRRAGDSRQGGMLTLHGGGVGSGWGGVW